ncbi:MAG: hypothetical protein H0T64_00755 [Pyrinomonadaceae bacterium]|nr:hypothetical protein [Pyrinomonadaceae bacterium]
MPNAMPRQSADPAPGPYVTDLAPWRTRPPDPHEHENGAEGHKGIIACEEDD